MNDFDVAVIGGGAAGLMAAIAAARGGATTLVLEKAERVGKKILVTGNGRCNLSNESINGEHGFFGYRNSEFAKTALDKYHNTKLMAEFYRMGLMTKSDDQGWVYPYTKAANSVLNVLLTSVQAANIAIRCNSQVVRVVPGNRAFRLDLQNGSSLEAAKVILACGVSPLSKIVSEQPQVPLQPILGPMRTSTDNLKGLEGLRVDCNLTMYRNRQTVCQEFGQVQFKKTGLSGIAIFQLSRMAQIDDVLALDFLPGKNCDNITEYLLSLKQLNPAIGAYQSLLGIVHSQLAQVLLKAADLARDEVLDEVSAKRLAKTLQNLRFVITALPNARDAQVTRGGLDVSGFNPKSLESLQSKGLYACGEAMDVDGPCGGFNLHWAWASGLVAGKAAAQAIVRSKA